MNEKYLEDKSLKKIFRTAEKECVIELEKAWKDVQAVKTLQSGEKLNC